MGKYQATPMCPCFRSDDPAVQSVQNPGPSPRSCNAQIDVVLGFHNGGDETLNVTNVMGSINSPASFNIYRPKLHSRGA